MKKISIVMTAFAAWQCSQLAYAETYEQIELVELVEPLVQEISEPLMQEVAAPLIQQVSEPSVENAAQPSMQQVVELSELSNSPISYLDAIQKGVLLSPTKNSANARIEQQKELLTAAKAGYLPQIGATIKTSDQFNESDTSITPEVSLSQRVYDFGRVEGQVNQVEAETQRVAAMNQMELEDIARRISQAYILTNRFGTTLEYARQYVDSVGRVTHIARLRAEAGASSQSDLTQAKGRLASARLIADQIETDYNQNRTRLQKLLKTKNDLPLATHNLPDEFRSFLSEEVSYNLIPQYREAAAVLALAQTQVELSKAERFPIVQLVLTANKAVAGNNPGTGKYHGSDRRFELQVAQPLYQGGGISARVRAAEAAASAAEYKLDQVSQDLESVIATQKILVNQLEVKQQLLGDRIVVLEKTRDIYQEQYKLGTRSVIDLLNIEQEIYQANVDQTANQHDIWLAVTDYIFITGQAEKAFSLATMGN